MPGVLQTVLTGNVEPNMRVKLGVFGLDRWLDMDVAATGSDSPDRRELVPVAMRRVAERRGIPFDADDVWVVGDTARSTRSARGWSAPTARWSRRAGTPKTWTAWARTWCGRPLERRRGGGDACPRPEEAAG